MIFHAEYLGALAIGFFGSLHCLGMCGPIALVCPSAFPGSAGRFISALFYNGGRVVTYSLLGVIMGSIGKGFALFRWQQGLSIAMGVIIVLFVLVPGLKGIGFFNKISFSFTNQIKIKMSALLKKTSVPGLFSIGLVNGLLPCGLVYLALAGSLDMSGALEGAYFMAFFGLGTVPMMAGIHLMGNSLRGEWRHKLTKVIPVFVFVMGVLFILRGLGLGIPYISPSTDPHTGDIHCTMPSHRHQ